MVLTVTPIVHGGQVLVAANKTLHEKALEVLAL